MSSKVAVTGATGYLGRTLVQELLARGHQAVALSRNPQEAREGLRFEQVDLTADNWGSVLDGCATVFHLAADLAYFGSPGQLRLNVEATDKLARHCAAQGVARMVFASSIEATGSAAAGQARTEDERGGPLSPYGLSKLLAEERLATHGESLSIAIARIGIVFGPEDRWTAGLAEAFRDPDQLQDLLALGENRLALVHRDDAVEGMLRLAAAEDVRGCYHVASAPVSLDVVLAEFAAARNLTLPVVEDLASRRAQLAERVWHDCREGRADLRTYLAWPHPDSSSRDLSSQRLRAALGWSPGRTFTRGEIGAG